MQVHPTMSGGPMIKLNNGVNMPLIGLGTWKAEKGEIRKSVATALELGYR